MAFGLLQGGMQRLLDMSQARNEPVDLGSPQRFGWEETLVNPRSFNFILPFEASIIDGRARISVEIARNDFGLNFELSHVAKLGHVVFHFFVLFGASRTRFYKRSGWSLHVGIGDDYACFLADLDLGA